VARWFPVARSAEIVPRHVAQTQLLGHEIALWRSDAGAINAWENRCPHRGVRLSIGFNTGNEVRCQYHAWRFASGSGQCTFIPAHPTQKPASGIRAGVYAVIESHHFVWVSLDPLAEGLDSATEAARLSLPASIQPVAQDTTLRSMFVNAAAEAVGGALLKGYRVDAATMVPVAATGEYTFIASAHGAAGAASPPMAVFLLQPVTQTQTVIHGLLRPDALAPDRISALRYHNVQLSQLRDAVEARHAASASSRTIASATTSTASTVTAPATTSAS
jgi:nitrite reductase/ring-hydroxylating ferredoxin subunit